MPNPPKEKNLPRVCIHWYDAHDAMEQGWHDFEDIKKKADVAECTSMGWLFKEDDNKYVLIADISQDEQGGRVTVIPKKCATKIEYLILSYSEIKFNI